ncbi:MAG: hypothetical protein ABI441_17035 [Flavobacterium sp.]
MKKTALLIILLSIFVACKTKKDSKPKTSETSHFVKKSKIKNSNSEYYGLIKTVTSSHYKITDSTEIITDKKPIFVHIQNFDSLGNTTKNQVIDENKWMSYDTKNVFEGDKKIASSTLQSDSKLTNYTFNYKFDGKNLIESKKLNTGTNSIESIKKYNYNSEKLKSIEHYIRLEDSLQMITNTFFNDLGTITEEIEYEHSKISERNLYDSIGRISISYSSFNSNTMQPTNVMYYTYDDQGNIATKIDNAYSFKYEYDFYGNQTVRYRFDNDTFYCPTQDCVIGVQYYHYEYDDNKNWIKKIEYSSECIPTMIETRAFEYFDKHVILNEEKTENK